MDCINKLDMEYIQCIFFVSKMHSLSVLQIMINHQNQSNVPCFPHSCCTPCSPRWTTKTTKSPNPLDGKGGSSSRSVPCGCGGNPWCTRSPTVCHRHTGVGSGSHRVLAPRAFHSNLGGVIENIKGLFQGVLSRNIPFGAQFTAAMATAARTRRAMVTFMMI